MLDTIYGYVPDWAVSWLPGGGDYQNRQATKKLVAVGAALGAAYLLLGRRK